ncbi:CAAX amino terminal protease self- immunity [Paenibacillus larvae subsp. larvae]|uniref:CAAX amino terminal protease self-immunity n=3 Tax=Paenibacillus larvae TaxID=1464 RepID=A0A2L1UBU9_9BACL|nr:CAAX amino terminal protease self- immunity [Paenibacillus larvae subsp. larvae]AVF30348.1 CAAX amino terminal protease self- immunity [Paenibacillus larvae subsp. larvae]
MLKQVDRMWSQRLQVLDRRGQAKPVRNRIRKNVIRLADSKESQKRQGIERSQNRSIEENKKSGLLFLLFIAIMEEIIFRDWLVQLSMEFTGFISYIFLIWLSIISFSLLHLRFGWNHVISKTPLAVINLCALFSTGSVISAIIAHMLFNYLVWKDNSLVSFQHAASRYSTAVRLR